MRAHSKQTPQQKRNKPGTLFGSPLFSHARTHGERGCIVPGCDRTRNNQRAYTHSASSFLRETLEKVPCRGFDAAEQASGPSISSAIGRTTPHSDQIYFSLHSPAAGQQKGSHTSAPVQKIWAYTSWETCTRIKFGHTPVGGSSRAHFRADCQ